MRFTGRLFKIMLSAGVAVLAIGLLTKSDAVSAGMRLGLSACANTLIPSLFPFMALSGFLSLTEYGAVLARPLHLLWRYVYRVPDEAGAVVLLSLIGGYPVGAKGISSLLKRGVIDEATAGRMLSFCVNCGPSFLITAVGTGMLADKSVGVILFVTQTAATLLIGAAASLRTPIPCGSASQRGGEPGGIAFVAAVSGASVAMMTICAFAVLFSGILSLLNATALPTWIAVYTGINRAVISALISGFFEVTSGCITASGLGGEASLLLLSAFASFGGISVIFQIISCLRDDAVSFRPFLLSRLAHIPLAAAMALPLWKHFCRATEVSLSATRPIASRGGSVWVSSACLIGMCTILLFFSNRKTPLHKPLLWDKISIRCKRK